MMMGAGGIRCSLSHSPVCACACVPSSRMELPPSLPDTVGVSGTELVRLFSLSIEMLPVRILCASRIRFF